MNVLKILFCCAAITIAGCGLEEETKGWAPIAIVGDEASDADDPAADGALLDCFVDDGGPGCCTDDRCCFYDEGDWHCD